MRALAALLAAAALAGCASAPTTWGRVDGTLAVPAQFEADKTYCQGEVVKANMGAGENRVLFGSSRELDTVFAGCMGGRGYIQQK